MAGVGEGLELRLDGSDHLRVAVAGVDHGDARREIDVAPSVDVPHLGILCLYDEVLREDADAARKSCGTPLFNFGIGRFNLGPWEQEPGDATINRMRSKRSSL